MSELAAIFIGTILVNNFVLTLASVCSYVLHSYVYQQFMNEFVIEKYKGI